jgi:hypothetical protein
MFVIRFSSSNLTALCAAYIILTGAPYASLSNLELQIPRQPPSITTREVSSTTVRSVSMGIATLGIIIMLGTHLMTLGFCIIALGGMVSITAAFGQMFGWWDWTENRLQMEEKEDMDRLGRLMGVLRVKGGQEVISLNEGEVGEIRLETAYGILVTKSGRGGFAVSLEKDKEETVEADLRWATNLKQDQSWVNKAREIVIGEQWEYLLSLYP